MDFIDEINTELKGINFRKEIEDILNEPHTKERIIELNQEQLAVLGQDSKGNELKTINALGSNAYSDFTIRFKNDEGIGIGAITDHVTLYDKGSFYDSFKVKASNLKVTHTAKFNKPDGNIQDNFDTDIEDVLSLNQDNIDKVVEEIIIPELIKIVEGVL